MNNESCQIAFPWDGILPPSEVVIIRDVDVVGVGAYRRQQIEFLQKNKQLVLWTYEKQISEGVRKIYDEELLRTLHWLRPLKLESKNDLNLQQEQKHLFAKIFPETQSALGLAASRVRDAYLQEMEWSSWLLQDHWRYFVGFLSQRFPQQKQLTDVAYWEWVHAWLEVQPFELSVQSEAGLVSVNPSLQIVPLQEDNLRLGKSRGMYAFVYSWQKNKILEKELSEYEALLIDLLQEDRKYTESQLLAMAQVSEEFSTTLSAEQWQGVFKALQLGEILSL